MSVKSRISNKTYTTSLDLLEPEDRDAESELYQVAISGRNIMIAPGKNRMEDGIAYGYAYAIRRNKVVCKLGVYEKKTESMPLIFDLSTFPEGSMCLFEEYDKNPSLLVDLEMSNATSVFDYLVTLYEKIPEPMKQLKLAYRNLHERYKREGTDKDMKPILAIISSFASVKKQEITKEKDLIRTLQDRITGPEPRPFVLTLLALQYVLQVEFQFKPQVPDLLDIISRWKVGKVTTVIEVDPYTQEMIQEMPYVEPMESGIQSEEIAQPVTLPVTEPVTLPAYEPVIEPVSQPEPLPEAPKTAPFSLLRPLGPPELEMETPEPKAETKAETKPKKAVRKKDTIVRQGTSLNDVGIQATVEPTKPKIRLKKSVQIVEP